MSLAVPERADHVEVKRLALTSELSTTGPVRCLA
jgi:hypothetical protein